MASIWQLIKDGHYREACTLADTEYGQQKDALCLRNKVLALLCLGEFEESLQTSQTIIDLTKGTTDSDFIFQGVAHWLSGADGKAIVSWKNGLNCSYTDAAGGIEIPVLLYYAAARKGDATLADESLKLLSSKLDPAIRQWPAPIGAYLLGQITKEDVATAISQNAVLKAKQQCQACFAFGVKELASRNKDSALSCFCEAAGLGPVTLARHEIYLARNEMSLLKG